MNRRNWLLEATRQLNKAEVDSPRRSAELLLAQVLKLDRLALIRDPDLPLSPAEEQALAAPLERLLALEPLDYILGKREFFGLEFEVSPATLIPRPDSECLVEAALKALPDSPAYIADFGCGTGCLGISLLKERQAWSGLALDISPQALAVAKRNARTHGLEQRLDLKEADFRQPEIFQLFPKPLDLLISNPPYISSQEYAALDPKVRAYEPASALVPLVKPKEKKAMAKAYILPQASNLADANKLTQDPDIADYEKQTQNADLADYKKIAQDSDIADYKKIAQDSDIADYGDLPQAPDIANYQNLPQVSGLADYENLPQASGLAQASGLEDLEILVNLAAKILKPGGWLLLEHGSSQGQASRSLCDPKIWTKIHTGQDLAGRDRYLQAQLS